MAAARVLYNRRVTPHHFCMGLGLSCALPRPGQFVMLRLPDTYEPLLRRPFSVYNVPRVKGRAKVDAIEILYKVVGSGTGLMSELKPGDELDVLGPLGNSFTLPRGGLKRKGRVIMVAGGIGVAPLHWLAVHRTPDLFFFGVATRSEVALARPIKKLGCKLRVTTEDGSSGTKGLVTGALQKVLSPLDTVYACGPKGMLRAVAALAAARGATCYVSLETTMACGLGACMGCAVHVNSCCAGPGSEYKLVCVDGPVFNGRDIRWGAL